MRWNRHMSVALGNRSSGFQINKAYSPTQLRVIFKGKKTIDSTIDNGRVDIYNLSENNRELLGEELDRIILLAGYENNVSEVFSGEIRDVIHERQGADVVSRVSIGDGDAMFRFAHSNHIYDAGTALSTVLGDLAEDMGLHNVVRGQWMLPPSISGRTLRRPKTIFSSSFDAMNELSRSYKFYWSIQNGQLEIIPFDASLTYEVTVSSESGLVDLPKKTDNGCEVKCLFSPQIRPNRQLRLETVHPSFGSHEKKYRISAVQYDLDNRGEAYYCTIVGESLTVGNKVNTGKT